jgi:hypothetical protein
MVSNRSIDFWEVTLEHDWLLTNYRRSGQSISNEIWTSGTCRCASYLEVPSHRPNFSGHGTGAGCKFRVPALVLSDSPAHFVTVSRFSYTNYARLVIFSFGFQNVFQVILNLMMKSSSSK